MEGIHVNRFSTSRFSKVLLLASAVTTLSLTAYAQNRGQNPNYPQNGDPYYQNDPRGFPDQGRFGNDRFRGNQTSLVGRVMADINRTASANRLDGRDQKRFNEAARFLQDFDARMAQGRFDNGKLDRAIENLSDLVNSNHLSRRDRDILARDVQDLRQFRSTRGRFPNGGFDGDGRSFDNRRFDQNRQ